MRKQLVVLLRQPGRRHADASGGRIVNRSSETSNFLIRITYYDAAGNQVAEGVDTVTDVERSQTSPWPSTASNAAKGKVDCRVVSVRRIADPLE